MSFFADLFAPIPGGTPVGNKIRDVANELSGGLLGNGAMIISQTDYDIKNLSDSDYIAKYGKTKTGVPVAGVTPNPNIMAVEQQLKSGVNSTSSVKVTLKGLFERYWLLLIFPLAALVMWLYGKLFTKKTYKTKRYGKK